MTRYEVDPSRRRRRMRMIDDQALLRGIEMGSHILAGEVKMVMMEKEERRGRRREKRRRRWYGGVIAWEDDAGPA